jgi:hypothetical protein
MEGAPMKDVRVTFDPAIDFPIGRIRAAAFSSLLLFGVALAAGAPHSQASGPGEPRREGVQLRLSFETSLER